eukprot:g6282.t1
MAPSSCVVLVTGNTRGFVTGQLQWQNALEEVEFVLLEIKPSYTVVGEVPPEPLEDDEPIVQRQQVGAKASPVPKLDFTRLKGKRQDGTWGTWRSALLCTSFWRCM